MWGLVKTFFIGAYILQVVNSFVPCSSFLRRVRTEQCPVDRTKSVAQSLDASKLSKRMVVKCLLSLNNEKENDVEETVITREQELITLTRRNVESLKNAISEPDLLDGSFKFVGATVPVLDKETFISSIRSFPFAQGFPDLDWQPHDFRVDPDDPSRVWYTFRFTGTHLGDFTYFSETYPPTGIKVESPPESNSMKWNDDNKCVELNYGYVIDELDGNTNGVGGVLGMLEAIGAPQPRAYLSFPPAKVLGSIFARSPKKLNYTPAKENPISETAMIGLTRQIVADFPNLEIGLLADDFVFSSPAFPRLNRVQFVEKVPEAFKILEGFPDYRPNPSQLRVDPFDAARVFCTIKPTGTNTLPLPIGSSTIPPTNRTLEGQPEAVSVIFNEEGEVVRLSYGYGMSRWIGNTGGLAGVAGIRFAMGKPISPFFTRPLVPHALNWRNYLLDPVDKLVDEIKDAANKKKPVPKAVVKPTVSETSTVAPATSPAVVEEKPQEKATASAKPVSATISSKPVSDETKSTEEPATMGKKKSRSGFSILVDNLSPSPYSKPKQPARRTEQPKPTQTAADTKTSVKPKPGVAAVNKEEEKKTTGSKAAPSFSLPNFSVPKEAKQETTAATKEEEKKTTVSKATPSFSLPNFSAPKEAKQETTAAKKEGDKEKNISKTSPLFSLPNFSVPKEAATKTAPNGKPEAAAVKKEEVKETTVSKPAPSFTRPKISVPKEAATKSSPKAKPEAAAVKKGAVKETATSKATLPFTRPKLSVPKKAATKTAAKAKPEATVKKEKVAKDLERVFSAKLIKQLKNQLGQSSQYRTFVQRSNQFVQGTISARSYRSTLASTFRTQDKTPLISSIIEELPTGNQKKALVNIFQEKKK